MKTSLITTLSVLGVIVAASVAMAANAGTLGLLDPQPSTTSNVVTLTGDDAPLGSVPGPTEPPASTTPIPGVTGATSGPAADTDDDTDKSDSDDASTGTDDGADDDHDYDDDDD